MTAAVQPSSSAAGLLTLLADDNEELKHYALVHLNKLVHEFWFQIASYIGSVEALYEDDEFKDRELAALIASKVLVGVGLQDRPGGVGSRARAVQGVQDMYFWQCARGSHDWQQHMQETGSRQCWRGRSMWREGAGAPVARCMTVYQPCQHVHRAANCPSLSP